MNLQSLPDEQLTSLIDDTTRRIEDHVRHNFIDTIFPEPPAPLNRLRYPKHLEFMKAGKDHRERLLAAGNRTGKTLTGAYEVACHATGRYPHWWEGRRFDKPPQIWCAGKSSETTRDIVQRMLFGNIVQGTRKLVDGTGMIPDHLLGDLTWKIGVSNLIDTIQVEHITSTSRSPRYSVIGLKAYQQGRGSFEGTAQDVIWLDEEPPMDVYGECLIRTMTTNGIILITFTPLEGWSEVVLAFFREANLVPNDAPNTPLRITAA